MNSVFIFPQKPSVASHWHIVVVAMASVVALMQLSDLNAAVAGLLILMSLWRSGFWLIVVPSLICFAGFERTVFLDPALQIATPLNVAGLPETWLACMAARCIAYWIESGRGGVDKKTLYLVTVLAMLLAASSFWFIAIHGGLPFVNKAPLKLLVFMILAGAILSEIGRFRSAELIWRGLLYATIIGAFQRLVILAEYPVKEPGVYAYTGVFIAACMVFLTSRSRDVWGRRLLFTLFWSLVLLLHLSASRTQLALLAVTLVILVGVLAARSLPFIAVSVVATVASLPLLQREFVNYLLHKMAFFFAVLNADSRIGDSASVRRSTMLNILDGNSTDVANLMIGRGAWGYIDFQAHPDPAIYTQGAFSDIEHSLGMYFHLHFVANEVMFYFGALGMFVLGAVLLIGIRAIRHPLEFPLLLYFAFNFMFRLELLVLIPVVLWAWRHRLAAEDVAEKVGTIRRALIRSSRAVHEECS